MTYTMQGALDGRGITPKWGEAPLFQSGLSSLHCVGKSRDPLIGIPNLPLCKRVKRPLGLLG